MSRFRVNTDEGGFTLLEVVVSILIIVIAMGATASYQLMSNRTMQIGKDRVFAIQKAVQMIEELRAYTESSGEHGIRILDSFDNGTSYSTILTTDTLVTAPDDPLSGNRRMGSYWRFCRQVRVTPIGNEARARRTTVRVFYSSGADTSSVERVLAEVSTVMNTIGEAYPPTQAYDMYILALESVPGWWTDMSSMRPMFQSALARIEARNPGLKYRTHWITRMSYGRDSLYTPYSNMDKAPTEQVDWVYFYPGTVNPTEDLQFYVPESFRSRIYIDTMIFHLGSYAVADQFNHAMRYPDELATFDAYEALDPGQEISYRMFLEELISYPENYENCIIVNLHGELVPVPPIRNYSDPAKDPIDHPDARVVVHPERLYYNTPGTVALRVYPYLMDPDTESTDVLDTVCIKVVGQASLSRIELIEGNDTTAYAKRDASPDSGHYSVSEWGDSMTIWLYGSPAKHPYNSTTSQGLPTDERLYGLEYIPCPVESASDFSRDLTAAGADIPKNTARWIIHVNTSSTQMLTVETSIGGSIGGYPNISRTYAWIGEDPPVTELFQILGDPRHMPYADVKMAGNYNRYFVAVPSNYGGFENTRSGWENYKGNSVPDNDLDCDVWRLTELIRTAVLKSHSIFTAMTGFTCYYFGLGGEFGGDMSDISEQKLNGRPWNRSIDVIVDEIVDYDADEVKSRIPVSKDTTWCALPWLGEIFPDKDFATYWDTIGNLPTSDYYRADYEDAGFPYYRSKCTDSRGCATFLNGVEAGGSYYFMHEYRNSADGLITSVGTELEETFDLGIPDIAPGARPFTLDYGDWSRKPINWEDYQASRCTTETFCTYYTSSYSNYDASATVLLSKGADWGYFLVNGLSFTGVTGAPLLARLALAEVVDCFLRGGDPSLYGERRISQLPRIEITSPDPLDEIVDPNNLDIEWKLEWLRWDGEAYSPAYDSSFAETTEVVCCLKYSSNGGKDWLYLDDDPAEIGERPDGSHELKGVTSYTWSVSSLPEGTYLLRLEGYRSAIVPHYSYHQIRVFIERSTT